MSKAFRWRVLLVVAVLGGAVALVLTRPVVLGLELRGAVLSYAPQKCGHCVRRDGFDPADAIHAWKIAVDLQGLHIALPLRARHRNRSLEKASAAE